MEELATVEGMTAMEGMTAEGVTTVAGAGTFHSAIRTRNGDPGRPAILILLVGSRGRTGTTVDLPPICPGSSRKEKAACGSG